MEQGYEYVRKYFIWEAYKNTIIIIIFNIFLNINISTPNKKYEYIKNMQ